MGQWTRDHVPFPGQAFRETVQLMRDEALVNDTVRVDGRHISLRALTWPLLNVVAAKDYIVPCAAARPVPSWWARSTRRCSSWALGTSAWSWEGLSPRPPCRG